MFSVLLNIYINQFAAGSRQYYRARQDNKRFACDFNKQSTLLIINYKIFRNYTAKTVHKMTRLINCVLIRSHELNSIEMIVGSG